MVNRGLYGGGMLGWGHDYIKNIYLTRGQHIVQISEGRGAKRTSLASFLRVLIRYSCQLSLLSTRPCLQMKMCKISSA
jgi:hypothetical protein